MNMILRDWHDFCSGKKDLDKSCFLGLFKVNLSYKELENVFSYFDQQSELLWRLESVLKQGTLQDRLYLHPMEKNRKNPEYLMDSAMKDLREYRKVYDIDDDVLIYSINNAKAVFSNNPRELYGLKNDGLQVKLVFEFLGDCVSDNYVSNDKKIYAIAEALYGLAANYRLCWYIMSPLINIDFDFSYYFELWKGGGDYVLTKDKIIVYSIFDT